MSNPTNAVAPAQKRDIRQLLQSDSVKAQIALALPQHMTVDRMTRVFLTAIIKTPKLMSCTPESLLQALMLCSQTGLEPDGRNAHLIPYGDQVQVIFDYKGLVALAERNGVECIFADQVCENDEFDAGVVNGEKTLMHKINWRKPRGNPYAFYASCRRNNRLDVEVMTKEEVDAIRKRSRAGNNGPWVTDYSEMAKKTVLRRMSKRWDLTPELREAMTADDDTPPEFNVRGPKGLPTAPAAATTDDDVPFLYNVGEKMAEPAKPTEEPPPAEATKADPIPQLLELMAKEKITEAMLLKHLREIHAVDDSLNSLSEIGLVAPNVITNSIEGWKIIVKQMAAKKEAK